MTIRATATTMLLTFSTLGLGAACAVPEEEDASSTAAAISGDVVLACQKLTVNRGAIGSGQTAAALAVRDQSGTADDWNKYVELDPRSSIACSYQVPSGTAASALAVRTNYRGPKKSTMRWLFEAYDFTSSTWVYVGDNAFAASWVWTAGSLPMPAPAPRFVSSTGEIRVRYRTDSSADASLLDELVVVASASGATDAGAPPDSGTTTDAGTTPPPPATGRWMPKPGTSWQWQLSGALNTSLNVAAYDIDLYDSSQATIDQLHAAGRKVICYFSAGSWESYRADAKSFPSSVLGKTLSGWPDEKWLDIRSPTVRSLMQARLDVAAQKKCDAVEPDNVDGYANANGFGLTAADQLSYNRFLAAESHARGLSVALKNDLDQVAQLVADFDFAVNEECFRYNECSMLSPFIQANKAVLQVEYGSPSLATSVCPKANAMNFDSLIKNLSLDATRTACR